MRIVMFRSGLGNQIFYYLMTEYLKEKYPKERIYGYYPSSALKKHNGLEIHKVFDVKMPESNIFIDQISKFARLASHFSPRILGRDGQNNDKSLLFVGYWQDKRYFLNNITHLKFQSFTLNEINRAILNKIMDSNSVSVHIRRGDYLDAEVLNRIGLLQKTYYLYAIDFIKKEVSEPRFFFFSDDIAWVKSNIHIDNSIYVDCNSSESSYIDMYLMSKCKHNIIANSTFSYWAAMLNKNNSKIVIYPRKWFRYSSPDIFPENWVCI